MSRPRALPGWATLATATAIALAGCTGASQEPSQPQGSDGGTDDGSTESDQDPEGEAGPVDLSDAEVIASVPSTEGDGLELEVLRAERLSQGAVGLVWQVRNTSDEDVGVNTLFGASGAEGISLESESRRAPPFRDDDGNCLCVGLFQLRDEIPPDGVKGYHSLHPDLGEDEVTIVTRRFEDIPDVPVSESDVASPSEDRPAVRVAASGHEGVHLDVHGLERHDDLAVLRATIVNDSDEDFDASMARASFDFSWGPERRRNSSTGQVSFVDPATDHHHRTLNSPDDWCWCENNAHTASGESRDMAWVYNAPDAETSHVAITVPWFGVVPGVPVIEDPGELQLAFNDETVDDLEIAGDRQHALIRSIEEFEGDTRTRVIESDGESTDVALASDVLFDFDSDELRPDADPLLEDLVEQLEQAELSEPVVVEGHTDSQGSRSYNQELSERRAERVLDRIEDMLDRDDLVLEAVGHGQDEPAVEEETEDDEQRNRRVTVRVPDA